MGVWKISGGYLEEIYGMSDWYVSCQNVSEGQVR